MSGHCLTGLVAGLAAMVCLAPAPASAHAGDNDPQHVHACIATISKVVRIVGVNGSCLTAPPLLAETPAHWNRRGPQGLPGPAGPAGAEGPAGQSGAPGADGVNGANGLDGTSVTLSGYFTGRDHGCPNGGVILGVAGAEAYVCHGADGGGTVGGGRRADGPCFDASNRFVNCGNGTVTDTATGLIWTQDSSCLQGLDWMSAHAAAGQLAEGACGLADHSTAGDWRLPTVAEWTATVSYAWNTLGCSTGFTNDAGTACYGDGSASSILNLHPAGLLDGYYWASDPQLGLGGYVGARFVSLSAGFFSGFPKTVPLRAWAVRSTRP